MQIALVITVLNEASGIDGLLEAIGRQTRKPDEVIIVDGGSTDGTAEKLNAWAEGRESVRVIAAPGTNIATGRNTGIAETTAEVVAVTDGGALPEPEWLERLLGPLASRSAAVSMGFYEAATEGKFQTIVSCLNLPDVEEVIPDRFMPSSRSIAFAKQVWEQTGGYPEWLDIGEDMAFNFKVLNAGATRAFVPDAVVAWSLRRNIFGFVAQYFRYSEGDGIAAMFPQRHAARFLAFGIAAALAGASFQYPILLAGPALVAAWWMRKPYRRARRRLSGLSRLLAYALLPLLEVIMDIAKMAGYVSGRIKRKRIRPAKGPAPVEHAGKVQQ